MTILCFCAAMLLASCGKKSEESTYDGQESTIESFISARQSASDTELRTVYNGGSARLVITEGEGAELGESGSASVYYAGYVLSGSSVSAGDMFWTNHAGTAESAGWSMGDETEFRPDTLDMAGPLLTGLRNGLKGVRGGEECFILFSGKYGFGNADVGTIPAKSALAFHIWVEEIL